MDAVKLNAMSHDDLKSLAVSCGVSDEFMESDSKMIAALRTFPNTKRSESYLDSANVGDLVAFRTDDYRVKSAKIVAKSSSEKLLKLETSYGKKFIVAYQDVVWVNTNGLWPKWVYTLMKENEND